MLEMTKSASNWR